MKTFLAILVSIAAICCALSQSAVRRAEKLSRTETSTPVTEPSLAPPFPMHDPFSFADRNAARQASIDNAARMYEQTMRELESVRAQRNALLMAPPPPIQVEPIEPAFHYIEYSYRLE